MEFLPRGQPAILVINSTVFDMEACQVRRCLFLGYSVSPSFVVRYRLA